MKWAKIAAFLAFAALQPDLPAQTNSDSSVAFSAPFRGSIQTASSDSTPTNAFALPLESALPIDPDQLHGFSVRLAQAPVTAEIANPNSWVHAVKQLNGTLRDARSGVLVPNVAPLGPNPRGTYEFSTVNFHLYGDFAIFGADNYFPTAWGQNNYFATEVIAYLALPAGLHRMGVSVCADCTDGCTDDGFRLFAGVNPRDFFSPVVASYLRTTPIAHANSPNTNEFTIYAPVEGLYPFRLVHWQLLQDVSLEWYSIHNDQRILINADHPGALIAHWYDAPPRTPRPFVAELSPLPDAAQVSPAAALEIMLCEDEAAADPASIQLWLNGQPAQITITPADSATMVRCQPDAPRQDPTNTWRLVFSDQGDPVTWFTNQWSYTIELDPNRQPVVTGQWDFESADLSATIGHPLEYFGGPDGETAQGTRFGATTDFGIPDIDGVPAKVMRVPGDRNNRIGYLMRHGIGPNGGGLRVNQYTLTFDIYWDPEGWIFASFINMDLANLNDGDFFLKVSDGGFGQGDSYAGNTVLHTGRWHRVSFAVDMAAPDPVVTKFLDGQKHADQTGLNNVLDGDRRSLDLGGALLFADGDDGERSPCYVNSIQIRDGKLSDAALAALGGPAASGIPVEIGKGQPQALLISVRRIGDALELTWPEAFSNCALEATPRLDPPDWRIVKYVPSNSISVPLDAPARFFRVLRLP